MDYYNKKNNMYDPKTDTVVDYAMMIADTFNVFAANKSDLTPDVKEGIIIKDNWIVDGYLIANDCIISDFFEPNRDKSFYGFLLHSKDDPKEFITVIRGTASSLEWIDNLKTLPVSEQNGHGKVEDGFYDIYRSMKFVKVGQKPSDGVIAANGIDKYVKENDGKLTVIGHSLGAALSTYLTFDLEQKNPDNTSMCVFASPHTGNKEFVDAFDDKVKKYVVYNYSRDIVPTVPPPIFGFTDLKNLKEITPNNADSVIRDELLPNHHVVCYAAMLNYNYTNNWPELLSKCHDEPYCVVGKNNPTEKLEFKNHDHGFSLNGILNRINTLRHTFEAKIEDVFTMKKSA
jgi:hypothetical protein